MLYLRKDVEVCCVIFETKNIDEKKIITRNFY